jgi:peptidyl-prolyl cis-trans isomerase C
MLKASRFIFVLTAALVSCSFLNVQASVENTPEAKLRKELGLPELDLRSVKGDPVVAQIGDEQIKFSEVLQNMQKLPQQLRVLPLDIMFMAMRDQKVDMLVLEREAGKQETQLMKDPAVQDELEQAKKAILVKHMVEDSVGEVPQSVLKKKYNEIVQKFPKDTEEVKVYQIVLKSEKDAKDVMADLKEGVDFMKLARERSVDQKTAEKDGEVGFINVLQKGDMLPGFDVVFEKKGKNYVIPTGGYTQPIKAQGHWFVLKVMERRPLKAPKFDEVKPYLEAEEKQKRILAFNKKVRGMYKIKLLNPNTGKEMQPLSDKLEAVKEKLVTGAKAKKTEIAKK